MYKSLFIFCCICMVIAPAAFAQESAIPLEDVVISAYKSGFTYGQSSSVSIITQQDIERGSYRFVSDVLQNVPGLTIVQNSTLGGTASVFIRGAKTGNVVVLVDGVKINDPSTIERTFDFGTLTTDSIERIEIIKGPQSVLYGSDAIGGIINIVTKKGKDTPRAALSMYGGSYYTTQLSANFSGGDSFFNYSLTAGQLAARGYSRAQKSKTATPPYDNDGLYQRYCIGKFGLVPLSNFTIDAGFTAKESDLDLDDYALKDDSNSFENRKELSGFTQLEHTINANLKHSVTASLSRTVRSYDDFDDDGAGFDDFGANNRYTGTFASAEWLGTFTIKNINTLSIGVNYQKEYFKYQDYLNPSRFHYNNATVGFFAQNHFTAANTVFITAGVRADNNELFGWQQSYTISPAVVVPLVKTKFKGNWGKGYKAPSLYQIYGDGGIFTAENKDLKPEENTGFDVGIEQPIGKILTFEVMYFTNKYRNMIDYDSSSLPGKYINIGKVTTKGYESQVSAKPIEALTLTGGYTYLEAIDESTDKQLLRRPKHQAFGQVTISIDTFDISFIGTYVGKRSDTYFNSSTFTNEDKELKGYFKADIALHYALTPSLSINAKAENITDKEYQHVYGYTMPQRSYYIGLKATL